MNAKHVRNVIALFAMFWVLLGIVYPSSVTVLANLLFPFQAKGSLYELDGRVVASELICQPVIDPALFWFRPSATSNFPCNPLASGGSNIGPTNKKLVEDIRSRIELLKSYGISGPYPSDMVMDSGSGLEPYISLQNALLQAQRVSKYSGIPYEEIVELINRLKEGGLFAEEERINVIKLNMELLRWMRKDHFQKVY
jgi:K+-transporting ATPase ATPase C chain